MGFNVPQPKGTWQAVRLTGGVKGAGGD